MMDAVEEVAYRCELALLLELSTTPKPGLVDRLHDFRETRFRDFLASAASLRTFLRKAAMSRGRGLGRIIYMGAERFLRVQGGGNTHLGAWLLLAPLAAASGMSSRFPVSLNALVRNVAKILSGLSWRDTIWIFRAIAHVSPGGLGRVAYLDVMREETYSEIRRGRIKPLEALKPYKDYDVVAHEWVSRYGWSVGGVRFLLKGLKEEDVDEALAQTFLWHLAHHPDTLISRRAGKNVARIVSGMASEALRAGGIHTPEGRESIKRLDRLLRRSRKLRPGATADLLASTIAMALLTGWNP